MYKPYKKTQSERGVAVVMVLGLLTIMILLAVAFAITMRTERLAAGNAADTVRARELTHVALARALNELAATLGPTGSFYPDGKYPNWSATSSFVNVDGAGRARFNTNVYLLRGEASNYVPRALWDAATNADLFSPSNHWLAVESTNDGSVVYASESNLMGRVAYLIINCSGLLDANYAGGMARQSGTNPNEIVLGGETNSNFKSYRNTDIRYETMDALNALAGIKPPATNLFVYSRALPGYWSNNVIPSLSQVVTQVNLSGGRAELGSRQSEIFNALANVGFSNQEPSVIFNNLLDYVDPDSKPDYYTTPVESVPMINEVAVSMAITVSGTGPYNYDINGGVTNECWYPFVSVDVGQSFKLVSRVTFATTLGAMSEVPDDSPGETITPITIGGFSINKREFQRTISSLSIVDPVEINCTVYLRVELGGDVVDRLNVPIVLTVNPRGALGSNPSYRTNSECLDPRFNFDPANPSQWRAVSAGNTLMTTNDWTSSYLSANYDGDTNTEMFVANRPLLSVAELGYLAYSSNKPWHTIKLYGPNLQRVLDVFGLSTNVSDVLLANVVYRGLVNCNSNAALDAAAAVFTDMRVNQYSSDTEGHLVTTNDARAVVSNIFQGGICTNLSDIGRSLISFPGATNELQKESYFRNAFNLINLRQNMFTIIIEAQAAAGGNIPRSPARQRAVAIVWRDPFTGEMFVRHIKWLGD